MLVADLDGASDDRLQVDSIVSRKFAPSISDRMKRPVDFIRTKREHVSPRSPRNAIMPPSSQPSPEPDDGLEAAVDQAISACGGDLHATIRSLIVANDYLETEVGELMKAVSHAYARGRFNSYSG